MSQTHKHEAAWALKAQVTLSEICISEEDEKGRDLVVWFCLLVCSLISSECNK